MRHSWYQELFAGTRSRFAVSLRLASSWYQEPVVKLRGIRNQAMEFRGFRNHASWYQEPIFVVSGTEDDSLECFFLVLPGS